MPPLFSRPCARCWILAVLLLFAGWTTPAASQTSIYHLHNEASTTVNLKQLKTSPPDVAIQTANLRDTANGEKPLKQFDTQAGLPGSAGSIPKGSTMTFQQWMRKTASIGTLVPRARHRLNNSSGTLAPHGDGNSCHHDDANDVRRRTTATVKLVAIDGCISGARAGEKDGSAATNFMVTPQ